MHPQNRAIDRLELMDGGHLLVAHGLAGAATNGHTLALVTSTDDVPARYPAALMTLSSESHAWPMVANGVAVYSLKSGVYIQKLSGPWQPIEGTANAMPRVPKPLKRIEVVAVSADGALAICRMRGELWAFRIEELLAKQEQRDGAVQGTRLALPSASARGLWRYVLPRSQPSGRPG